MLGGFGGCAYDLTRVMGLNSRDLPISGTKEGWEGLELFRGFAWADLHNGLTLEENRRLAETVHVDEAITLILRGLMTVLRRRHSRRRKQ